MDCKLLNITDPYTNITIEDYICECGHTCHFYLDIILYFFITILFMSCYYKYIIAPHIHRYVLQHNDENIERGERDEGGDRRDDTLPKYATLYPIEVDPKSV